MPGNHASRIAFELSTTLPSVSGRLLNSTTVDRLARGLDRVQQLLLLAGQVQDAADLGLAALAAHLAERQHDLVGGAGGGDRVGEAGVRPHSLAGS